MSWNSETSSTTSTNDATNVGYVKDGVDYSEYALDFLSYEGTYYNYIKSYTTEEEVVLHIRENGIVAKSAKYDEFGELIELETDKEFDTIIEWVSYYKGEAASINFVLDNVYIGEDLVPLWKVLVDVNEEEDVDTITTLDKLITFDNQPLSFTTYQKNLLYVAFVLYVVLIAIILPLVYSAY